MKPLYLDWNLGLGDAIIQNGLVRTLAKERDVIIPCYKHNLPTVAHMFSDLSNVLVRPVNEEGPKIPLCDVLSIGINNPAWGTNLQWDQAFYEFAGVPFDAKWNAFFVPHSDTEIPPAMRSAFLLMHDDTLRGFDIDVTRLPRGLPIAKVTGAALLTDWRRWLLMAEEVHCIDSSFMHLAELMPTTGKLFYHKYARAKGSRQHTDAVLRKTWTVYE